MWIYFWKIQTFFQPCFQFGCKYVFNGFCIVASQDLFKVILAHVSVAFQVGNDQTDFFTGRINLLGCAAELELCSSGEDFQEGEFLLKNVQFTVVNTKKFNRVDGFEVDDRVCQCTSDLCFTIPAKGGTGLILSPGLCRKLALSIQYY